MKKFIEIFLRADRLNHFLGCALLVFILNHWGMQSGRAFFLTLCIGFFKEAGDFFYKEYIFKLAKKQSMGAPPLEVLTWKWGWFFDVAGFDGIDLLMDFFGVTLAWILLV